MGYIYELSNVINTIKYDKKTGGTPKNIRHTITMAKQSSLIASNKKQEVKHK